MRCTLLCMLEGVESGLCLREVSEVLEMLGVMHRVRLCMVEGGGELCSLEVMR